MLDNCSIDKAFQPNNILNLSKHQAKDSILAELQAKPTDQLRIALLDINRFTFIGMFYFQRAAWTNLQELHLMHNSVGDLGCKLITRANMQRLTFISLKDNRIGNTGIFHISKANWPQLQKLDASDNVNGLYSIKWISRSCFLQIQEMRFSSRNSSVNNIEITQLVLSEFPCLIKFNSYNRLNKDNKRGLYDQLERKYLLKMIKL